MTPRQRFRETMRYAAPDRAPLFEEGLRDDVMERWRAEGLEEGVELAELFTYDRREMVPFDFRRRPDSADEFPTSVSDLDKLRQGLDPDDPGRVPDDWGEKVKAWRGREHVLELNVHNGFFLSMGVGDWQNFERCVFQLADEPVLVRKILNITGEQYAAMAARVLSEVEVDFATFGEPIGGSGGSLISPKVYEEMVLPSYRPVFDMLHKHGVETICLRTYTNIKSLLPSMMRAGINCLWLCEVAKGTMDYRALRREFGRDLRLIAGIDLDTLFLDEAAMREEILANVPALLADGGYIPLADGRVRPEVSFENYACYRRLLEEVVYG